MNIINQHCGEEEEEDIGQGATLTSATSPSRKHKMMSLRNLLLLVVLACLPLTHGAPTTPCRYVRSRQSLTCLRSHLDRIPTDNPLAKNLLFNNNNLASLERDTLKHFPALVRAHFVANKIAYVDEAAFANLPHLQSLDLAKNDLAVLERGTLAGNPTMESLSLNENPLEEIPVLESASLQTFLLRACTLTDIPAASFSALPALETIDLRDNYLEVIPGDLFDALPRLKSVYLLGNPWRCGAEFDAMLEKYGAVIVERNRLTCFDSEARESTGVPKSAADVKSTAKTSTSTTSTETPRKEESSDDDVPIVVKHLPPVRQPDDTNKQIIKPLVPFVASDGDAESDVDSDDDPDLIVGHLLIYVNVMLIALIAGLCVGFTMAFLFRNRIACCSLFATAEVRYKSTCDSDGYEVVLPRK